MIYVIPILLSICILLYFFIKFYVGYKLEKYFNAKQQYGIFSFREISFNLFNVKILVTNFMVSFNILSIFSSEYTLFGVRIDKLTLKDESNTEISPKECKKTIDKKKGKGISPIPAMALKLIIYYFIRKICIYIEDIEISIKDYMIKCKEFDIKYVREVESTLDIKYKSISVDIGYNIKFDLESAEYKLNSDQMSMLSLLSFSTTLFLADIKVPDIVIDSSEHGLVIQPITCTLDFYSGLSVFNLPKFVLNNHNVSATYKITLKDIYLTLVYPKRDIKTVNFNQASINVEEIVVESIANTVFHSRSVHVALRTMTDIPVISVESLQFNYSTYDFVNLLRPIERFIDHGKPRKNQMMIQIPLMNFHLETLNISLKFTDCCSISLGTKNVNIRDRAVHFDEIRAVFENSRETFATANKLKCFTDEYKLVLSFDQVNLQQTFDECLQRYLQGAIFSWNAIKHYVSAGIYDSETLPFPIRILAKKFTFITLNSDVSTDLIIGQKFESGLRSEQAILLHILQSKTNSMKRNDVNKILDGSVKEIHARTFSKYKESFGEYKNYNVNFFEITFTMIDANLNSDSLIHKDSLIVELDGTISRFYPDARWETLEGINVDCSAKSAYARLYDFSEPLVSAEDVRVEGQIIFAEIDAQAGISKRFMSCDKSIDIALTATDVKIYSNLKVKFESLHVNYGNFLKGPIDDFMDIISLIMPDGNDPSPPLKWWDKVRYLFRGKYCITIEELYVKVLGNESPYNMSDFILFYFQNITFLFANSKIEISMSQFKVSRNDKSLSVLNFPKFRTVVFLQWISDGKADHHIIFPDVSRFNDPNYDSYSNFRAKSVIVDISTEFLLQNSESDAPLYPGVILDIAHIWWILEPLYDMAFPPRMTCPFPYKFYIPRKKAAPVMNVTDLSIELSFRINVEGFTVRIFDYFPTTDSKFSSSVDFSFVCPEITGRFSSVQDRDSYLKSINIRSKVKQVQMNLTDLHSKSAERQFPANTMIIVNSASVEYIDQLTVKMESVEFYANQVYVKYFVEYIKTAIHIYNIQVMEEYLKEKNKRMRGRSSSASIHDSLSYFTDFRGRETDVSDSITDTTENLSSSSCFRRPSSSNDDKQDLLNYLITSRNRIRTTRTLDNNPSIDFDSTLFKLFDNLIAKLSIEKIDIILESFEFDAHAVLSIEMFGADLTKDLIQNLYASRCGCNSITINLNYVSGQKQTISKEELKLNTVEIQFMQKILKSDSLYRQNFCRLINQEIQCKLNEFDIGILRALYFELISEDDKSKRQNELEKGDSFHLDFQMHFYKVDVEFLNEIHVNDKNINTAQFEIKDVILSYILEISGRVSISSQIGNILVKDVRDEARGKGTVFSRMVEYTSRGIVPHFRAEVLKERGTDGKTIISHFEIEIDPTVVIYDAKFGDKIKSLFTTKYDGDSSLGVRFYIKPEVEFKYKKFFIESSILPQSKVEYIEFMEVVKSDKIPIRTGDNPKDFVVIYFKIKKTKFDLSYYNDGNVFFPSVKDFRATLSDIVYRNEIYNVDRLCNKILSDISKMIIPQIFRHLFKIDPSQEFNDWLQDTPPKSVINSVNEKEEKSRYEKSTVFGNK